MYISRASSARRKAAKSGPIAYTPAAVRTETARPITSSPKIRVIFHVGTNIESELESQAEGAQGEGGGNQDPGQLAPGNGNKPQRQYRRRHLKENRQDKKRNQHSGSPERVQGTAGFRERRQAQLLSSIGGAALFFQPITAARS